MNNEKILKLTFASVYPLYIKKVERKNRTKTELDEVIFWMTGYDQKSLQNQIEKNNSFETFFNQAPLINPNINKITGSICGIKLAEIEDKMVQKIRYLDKLVDELAKGKSLDKIMQK